MGATVTVLGSGTVDPVPSRASTGFHLQVGASQILVDLGAGTLRNGQQAGLRMAAVQTVVLTHFHPDHTSDLVPFLFARKYAPAPWNERPPLTIYGPLGTSDFLEKIYAAWPSVRPNPGELSVVEMDPQGAVQLLPDDLSLQVFTAVHGDMTALSLRFEFGSKVIAFSGDTALCPGVVSAAQGADLLFCECSCFPRGQEPLHCRSVHLSWEDVAEICDTAKPSRLVLTHLYEVVLARRPTPLDSLSEILSIPVELATDRAQFTV